MQPSFEIIFHPVDLSAHGKNPKGLPIYRLVWADSRKTKLLYKGKIHIIPRYPILDPELADSWPLSEDERNKCKKNMRAHWILERWMSPEEFVGMSREKYAEMVIQFPHMEEFPSEGEYDFECWFPSEVDDVLVSRAIELRENRRKNVSSSEKRAEEAAAEELKEKQQDEIFEQKYEQAREESLTK